MRNKALKGITEREGRVSPLKNWDFKKGQGSKNIAGSGKKRDYKGSDIGKDSWAANKIKNFIPENSPKGIVTAVAPVGKVVKIGKFLKNLVT
tara:strand:- start:1177 stop:1452 length:276 start_codon:yes stop_codon:yes gene_type:complete